MTAIKAILFDLDGTLLDTLTDLADSMNSVLASLDLPTHTRDAYRYFVGDGMETLASRVLPLEHRTPAMIERCSDGMRDEYLHHWAVASRPYPGIPELLDALTGLGLTLTILSNKPEEFTRMMVNHFLPAWPWRLVRGARADCRKKPDPSAALAMAADLALAPAQFLYLGDTNTDMRTALSSGMYPIGALWGFRTRDELNEAGAKTLIQHPLEMLALLTT
jgi:phosphoglycolate phosphatase